MKSRDLVTVAENFEKSASRSFNEDITTALRAVLILEGWLAHLQQKYQFESNIRDDFGSEMEELKTAAHRIQKRLANLNPWIN